MGVDGGVGAVCSNGDGAGCVGRFGPCPAPGRNGFIISTGGLKPVGCWPTAPGSCVPGYGCGSAGLPGPPIPEGGLWAPGNWPPLIGSNGVSGAGFRGPLHIRRQRQARRLLVGLIVDAARGVEAFLVGNLSFLCKGRAALGKLAAVLHANPAAVGYKKKCEGVQAHPGPGAGLCSPRAHGYVSTHGGVCAKTHISSAHLCGSGSF